MHMETIPNSWAAPAPVKAAFFDIDGTLAHLGEPRLLPSSIQALEMLRARGIVCCAATGRGPADIAQYPVELFDGMVLFNGQLCTVGDATVREARFTTDILDALFAFAQASRRAMTFQSKHKLFSTHRTDNFYHVYAPMLENFPLSSLESIYESDVFQASVECMPGEEDELLGRLSGCELVRWCPTFVDVIPVGGGKGAGVAEVLAYLGLARAEAVAFGDSQNDISMFRVCGTSVALGNAAQETKAVATYVTDDVDDDGVYRACLRLGLI